MNDDDMVGNMAHVKINDRQRCFLWMFEVSHGQGVWCDGSHSWWCWLCPRVHSVSSWLGLCSGCTITFYDPDIFQPDCLKGLGSVPEMVTVWFAEMNNCEEDAWKGKRCWIILLPVQRM